MRSINPKKFSYEIVVDGCIQKLELEYSDEEAQVSFSGKSLQVNVGEIFKDTFSLILNGQSYDVIVNPQASSFQVFVNGVPFNVTLYDPGKARSFSSGEMNVSGPMVILSSMPGKVVKLLVSLGETVEKEQGLVVVEAMKMQNELKSPKAGRISQINVSENQSVNNEDPLLVVE